MSHYRRIYPAGSQGGSYPKSGIEIKGLNVKSIFDNRMVTVLEREKVQQEQVDKFCKKYNLSEQELVFPKFRTKPVYHQLLVNEGAGTLFCFVPKVGCTSLKVLYFIAQGLIPESVAETTSRKTVPDRILKDIVASSSLKAYDEQSATSALKSYYKFVMYRNPLERLVSAYRSKVKRIPLQGLEDEQPHYNWLRKRIYKYTHPQGYRRWYRDSGSTAIDIKFPDFVAYWLDNADYRTRHDTHLMLIFDLCEPCRVRYHYYGNFATFEQDANVLASRIGTSMEFLRQSYYKNAERETDKITSEYYGQLTLEQKIRVFKRLAVELDFYYHLFPSERNSHVSTLNITTHIP